MRGRERARSLRSGQPSWRKPEDQQMQMPVTRSSSRFRALLAVVSGIGCAVSCSISASAEQIVVSNYGTSPNGMPYAVALEKGFFRDFGVDVDGILSSDGGGTTIRNLLGGKLAYGEAAPSAVVSAVQGGADLRVVSGNVHTVAEFVWVAMPN